MRVPSHGHRDSTLSSDAMTPMIDVVFLLLVFFVCASAGQAPEVLLPAELSAGSTEAEIDPVEPDPNEEKPQEVRVGLKPASGGNSVMIELNENPVATSAELRSRLIQLAEAKSRLRIILIIDSEVSVQQGVAIYDLCQALKFEDISFGVRENSGA